MSILLLCMHTHMYTYILITCMSGTHESQKKALDCLELKLWMIMNTMVPWELNRGSCKSNRTA